VAASDPVAIVGCARTALGGLLGDLAPLAAPRLGAAAVSGALRRSGVAPGRVDEVILGCVLPAGQGQAPARQAARAAGVPDAVGCTTINKMCG
jgi:acetyl-CoA C-acetyltransferase